jgi:hypothetical protein
VVQDILPSRIQGTILTQHPQLLAVDLPSWLEFLTAFGFEQPAIQELLRSSPEAFYNSNVFQVGARGGAHWLNSLVAVGSRSQHCTEPSVRQ